MASTGENFPLTAYLPFVAAVAERGNHRQIYEANRHRVYSLCFWMTDNELVAEDLAERTFRQAFAKHRNPASENIDLALIAELRQSISLGTLSLQCGICAEAPSVRSNTLRVDLERAVVQLPPTERLVFLLHDVEGYEHARVARYLDLTCAQSQSALHEARLRIRQLLAQRPSK
jgi:RNA polymerase sigma-70 factor (ECF subfamily)